MEPQDELLAASGTATDRWAINQSRITGELVRCQLHPWSRIKTRSCTRRACVSRLHSLHFHVLCGACERDTVLDTITVERGQDLEEEGRKYWRWAMHKIDPGGGKRASRSVRSTRTRRS
jgi:hypothetical protein